MSTKSYYIDTSSIRIAGKNLQKVAEAVSLKTSALTFIELLNGVTKDDESFRRRSAAIRSLALPKPSPSGYYSIDAFLEYRQDYLDIGKLAITAALANIEDTKNVFEAKSNWYQYLLNKMIPKQQSDFFRVLINRLYPSELLNFFLIDRQWSRARDNHLIPSR